MSSIAIQVDNLSKQYRIGAQRQSYNTLRDTLADGLKRFFRPNGQRSTLSALHSTLNSKLSAQYDTFWALRNVSFEVTRSEVLGIIGRNGAGKSTLLKILSRVTRPTYGRARINGRVGSLLEVGTGFHSELTGRENIYLNGAVLGMTRTEIQRKFDEIVEFAEIEQFIDTPVKRYSSGMYMRLAFAVAAHLEPEILIVDEVLAVGDVAFQKKCLGKMGNVAREGRTVLFVSHNMVAIQSLCSRAIWLNEGQIMAEGNPAQVVASYLQMSFSNLTEQVWSDIRTAPGNDRVRLRRVCVRPAKGDSSPVITMRTPIIMEFQFWNLLPETHLILNFQLINEQGTVAFASNPTDQSGWHGRPSPVGLFRSRCYIPGDLLKAGQYRVLLSVIKNDSYLIYKHEDALVFEVQDSAELRRGWYGEMVGIVRPLLKWTTDLIESQPQIDRYSGRQDHDVSDKI
jgi:lipopolysaccharide transport system ATP-binding protein